MHQCGVVVASLQVGNEVLASEFCQVQQLQDKLAEMQALFGMGVLIGGAFKGTSC